jgi:Putative peptidoglycan binding domain
MTTEFRSSFVSRMWITSAFLWSLAAITIGCGHAQTVGPAVAPDEKSDSATTPAHHKTVTSDLKGPDGAPQNISISTSPDALLKPGAAKLIQQKLSQDGDFDGDASSDDGRARAALAKFQRRHDLPATGVPDDATVRKLGLKPEDIFRTGKDHGDQ